MPKITRKPTIAREPKIARNYLKIATNFLETRNYPKLPESLKLHEGS